MKAKSINICGINYSIEEVEFLTDGAAMGRSNSMAAQIYINRNMPDEVKQSTILHEIIHQIADRLGLDLKESDVRCLETGLLPFFKEVK